MNFDAYWERLCSNPKNTGIRNSASMKISVESFRAALRRAHEADRREGVAEGLRSKSIFEQIFG